MECSEGKELEVETALREALLNVVRHGCAHDATKSVEDAKPLTAFRQG